MDVDGWMYERIEKWCRQGMSEKEKQERKERCSYSCISAALDIE